MSEESAQLVLDVRDDRVTPLELGLQDNGLPAAMVQQASATSEKNRRDASVHVTTASGETLAVNMRQGEIELNGKEITDISTLAEALKTNETVQKLGLDDNGITDIGVLAEALKANQTLHTLGLWDNEITEVGALAGALKTNQTLHFLSLGGNRITEVGALAEALKTNQTLHTLGLNGNQITNIRALAEALMTNQTLQWLGLDGNEIVDICALTEALKTNQTLQGLGLERATLSEENALALLDVIEARDVPLKVTVSGNDLPQELVDRFDAVTNPATAARRRGRVSSNDGSASGTAVPAAPDAPHGNANQGAKKAGATVDSAPERNTPDAHDQFPLLGTLLSSGLHNSVVSASLKRAKLLFVGRGRSGKSSTLKALKKGRPFDPMERSTATARQHTLAVFAREDVQAQEWTAYQPIGQERQRVRVLHAGLGVLLTNACRGCCRRVGNVNSVGDRQLFSFFSP